MFVFFGWVILKSFLQNIAREKKIIIFVNACGTLSFLFTEAMWWAAQDHQQTEQELNKLFPKTRMFDCESVLFSFTNLLYSFKWIVYSFLGFSTEFGSVKLLAKNWHLAQISSLTNVRSLPFLSSVVMNIHLVISLWKHFS